MGIKVNVKNVGQQVVGEEVTINYHASGSAKIESDLPREKANEAGQPEHNRRDLVDELARAFNTEALAAALLSQAEFSCSMKPSFCTPISFWSRVLEEIEHGVSPGSFAALAACAARFYPKNAVFRRWRG